MYQEVELIGSVRSPGRSGPINGMYALQETLRRDGPSWLKIVDQPSDKQNALPWFWSWGWRKTIAEYAQAGRPFCVGPNVVFVNAGRPRIDEIESAILDAHTCCAMFGHSQWWADLICSYRGEANKAPIILCPYSAAPWPDPPLEADYDLLLFLKSHAPRQLIESLQQSWRTALFRYGRFQRGELIETARRAKACVYLAKHEHGSVAQAEIMAAGCPVISRHIVVSLGVPGRTAVFVTEETYPALQQAIQQAHRLDRHKVQQSAAKRFSSQAVIGRVIAGLQQALEGA